MPARAATSMLVAWSRSEVTITEILAYTTAFIVGRAYYNPISLMAKRTWRRLMR